MHHSKKTTNCLNTADPSFCFSAMAGEFPGAKSINELWELLLEGKTAPLHSLLPHWQVSAESVFAEKPGTVDRVYLDQAFTVDEPVGSPSRQVEIGIRVLEKLFNDPGLNSESLSRKRIGLILATSWSDESYFFSPQGLSAGDQVRVMADRLNLGGPALTLDTACSSFPYALEMARGLMQSGQADHVIVMAINTVLPLALYLGFSQLTAFSADACLRAFGAEANGIVPAECACAFFLEPEKRALEGKRQPLGTLKAIGLSSDGSEGSVFSPGKNAQVLAYQRAWQGLDPASADYLEAHGTATPLGDATELESVHKFFITEHSRQTPLTLGSIKAVLGHTLAAAGGPSLAKALLMLRHQHIPAQPVYTPSPLLENSMLNLATSETSGAANLQRLAISSFGFGGANAHIIIDRPSEQASELPEKNANCVRLNLALVDAEAALGGTFSLAEWAKRIEKPAETKPFPTGRLAKKAEHTLNPGYYLATDHVIDAHGYAMGPKALDHIDPFKLLIASLTGRITKQYPDIINNSETAMMVCSNMGGESFSNAYTRSEFFKTHQGNAPEMTVADVATTLPSMLSGYPAKIFNLRGCHQTLAGESGLFWQTLLTLPHWFDCGLNQILLGAGRYISGYSELRHCTENASLQGEGAGVLLLKPWEEGNRDALLVLRCAVFASHVRQFDEACKIAGIDSQQISQTIVCELDENSQDPLQPLYQCNGWLAEACGIEYLLQQAVTLERFGVIEIRCQGEPLFWLFSERVRPWQPAKPESVRFPYTLRFSHYDTPPVAAEAHREADKDRSESTSSDLPLDLLSDQVTATLLAGLRTRNLIAQQLFNHTETTDTQTIHHVIGHVELSQGSWKTFLQVDEQHPYFFDHPLDHVPGILLIAGGLQLIEQAKIMQENDFIHDLHVRFLRYVDKESPIALKLEQQKGDWSITIKQKEQTACHIRFSLKNVPYELSHEVLDNITPCRRLELLHKHRKENILVSELINQDQHYSVLTTPISPEHFFMKHDKKHLSMVYFLEIARQCYMQLAHDVIKVPLGIPMNLVSLHFSLETAIPHQSTLQIVADKKSLAEGKYDRTNTITLSLLSGQQQLGEVDIVAQVLADEPTA